MALTIEQRLELAEKNIVLLAEYGAQQASLNNQLHLLHFNALLRAGDHSRSEIMLVAQQACDAEFTQLLKDAYAKIDTCSDHTMAEIKNLLSKLPELKLPTPPAE